MSDDEYGLYPISINDQSFALLGKLGVENGHGARISAFLSINVADVDRVPVEVWESEVDGLTLVLRANHMYMMEILLTLTGQIR